MKTDLSSLAGAGRKSLAIIALSAALVSASSISAQTYNYSYASARTDTSGTFTISGAPGAYNLSSFSGTVAGVSYQTTNVGFAYSSSSNARIYLGGLLNGVDYYANNTNDFEESGAFTPGRGQFYDSLIYTTAAGGMGSIPTQFTLSNPQSYTYTYSFSSANPASTSGSFTVVGSPDGYKLTSFLGAVAGVSYNASTAGIAYGSDGSSIYLGGLVDGIDYVAGGRNDFEQSGAFAPGTASFSDTFLVATPAARSTVAASFLLTSATQISGAVPEPATWAMLVLGMGVVGYAMRRRQQVASGVSSAA